MKVKSLLLALLLVPSIAFAAPVATRDLTALGMSPQLADKVASIGNGTTSTEWGVNGTTELTLTDDTLTFSGAAASIVGGATSLTVTSGGTVITKAANDANRLLTFSGTSDTVLALAFGDGSTSAQINSLTTSSANAADDGALIVSSTSCKSGDCTARGGNIQLFGNEHASDGSVTVQLGDATGNFTVVGASGSVNLLNIEDNGDTTTLATSLTMNPVGDTNRVFTFAASSDTAHTLTFGDAGVTAAQTFLVSASTSDADDDSALSIAGGGAASGSRGAFVTAAGNEASGTGDLTLQAGSVANADVVLNIEDSSSNFIFSDVTSGQLWRIENDGDIQGSATNGGDIIISRTGKTIALDSGTAASACFGVSTPNGNTEVSVSTTCAVANSRVFYTRVGAVANMGTISTLTNPSGTGFGFASTGASDTLASSVVWMIIKEG